MRLLSRHTEDQADAAAPAAPAAPASAPATEAPAEPVDVTTVEAPEGVRLCPTCQAPLEADQDWCLQCGAAQSRFAGRMPGMRAAGTVAALTTVLVGGAVAASYAALQKEPPAPAQTTPTQAAQAPQPAPTTAAPSVPPPSPVDPAPTAPATTNAPPPATPPASSGPADTPSTSAGDSGSGGTSSGGSSSGSSGSGGSGTSTGSGSSGSGTSSKGSGTDGGTTTATLKPITLDPEAAALYDPYGRDTAAGDPTKALDDNITTSFPITVADGSETVGAGLALDLGKKRAIREIDLTLKTPGVGLEVYATDEADLPTDVLDSRWAHLRSLTSAGSAVDGHQKVKLGKGTTKYRHLLLWFTTPPTSGPTVRVTELQLLG